MAKQKFDFIQPFKDIPQFFKNFPKSFMDVFTGPITNPDEFKERKAKTYTLIYVSLSLTVLLMASGRLMSIVTSYNDTVSEIIAFLVLVCIGSAVAAFFMLGKIHDAEFKYATLECKNCKHRITYDHNVTYTVIDKKFSVNTYEDVEEKDGVPHKNSIRVHGVEYVTLKITSKCQECGTEKTFEHVFTTAECEKRGTYSYAAAAAMLAEFERAVRAEGTEGFEGKEIGTTANGVEITTIRTLDWLVYDFFLI